MAKKNAERIARPAASQKLSTKKKVAERSGRPPGLAMAKRLDA